MNILHPILVALKKAVLLTFVLVVMSASAQYYNIPIGYVKKDTARSTSIYYNEREGVAVQVVDLDLARLEHLIIRKSGNEYNLAYPGVYKASKRPFSVINGAFFADGKETTGASSCPCTPANPSYNNRCNFSVTLLHPDVDKASTWNLGRNSIGVINSRKGSEGRFIAFIIGRELTSERIKAIADNWGISRSKLIQGDGSHSAQILSNRFELYGENLVYFRKRKIPHMIGIYPK